MKKFRIIPLLMMAVMVVLSGCRKETAAQLSAADNEAGRPKDHNRFMQGAECIVTVGNDCPWGSVNGVPYADVFGFQSGTMNLIVKPGSCTIDGTSLILEAGALAGDYGPYYRFTPQGTSHGGGVSRLRLRVKNVSGAAYQDYLGNFNYDASTNTWSWSVTAPNYFEISTFTGFFRCQ